MTAVFYKDKDQTTSSDTGKSIRPVSDGEVVEAAVLNRPTDNLKSRTDVIADYLSVTKLERILEASRTVSLVEVDSMGVILNTGMLKIEKQGSSYFISPGHISDLNNSRDYRMVVTSSAEDTGNYSITKGAFHAFYTDTNSNFDPVFGLTNPSDCISLAVPRYSDAEIDSNAKKIERSSSLARPLRSSSHSSNYSMHHGAGAVTENTSNALIKSPSANKINISLNPTSTDLPGFIDAYDYGFSELYLNVKYSNAATASFELDVATIQYDETSSTFSCYPKSFQPQDSSAFDVNSISEITFIDPDNSQSSYTFSSPESLQSINLTTGISPPYDYIIPLFYHTGDRLVVSGVGSVLIKEVDRLHEAGATVMLRGDGKLITELVSGEIQRVETQLVCQVQDSDLTSGSKTVSIGLFNDLTLENSQYELDYIDIYDSSEGGAGTAGAEAIYSLSIQVKDSSGTSINTILDTDVWNGSGQPPLSLDSIPKNSRIYVSQFTGRGSKAAQEGDTLDVTITSSTGIFGITPYPYVKLRVNYVQVLE